MSAQIPDTMPISDLLKSTGYDCPERLQGKTFEESTTGGGNISIEANKQVSITTNGIVEITPTEGKDAMEKVTVTVNVPESGGGGSSGGGGAFRYFDGRNTAYSANPVGFWVIGKNQTSGKARCLALQIDTPDRVENFVQPIQKLNSDGLVIDSGFRETLPEVTEDVVAAALGA